MLKIWLFADPLNFEEDLENLKKTCKENIKIPHIVNGSNEPNFYEQNFDVLVFDWGGMSMGNSLLSYFSSQIVDYANEHESKLIVINSSFTKWAIEDVVSNIERRIPNILYGLEELFKFIENENK